MGFDPRRNARRDTAVAIGGINPIAGGALGGLFGGGGKPGNLGKTGTRVPDWQRGVPGAGVNPAAAQNPMNNPQAQARAQGGRAGMFAGLMQQMQQQRQPRQGNPMMPADMPQRLAAARAQRAALTQPSGGGQMYAGGTPGFYGPGGAGVAPQGRVAGYADGGKVINRKPNGKKC